jgi:hypothetical protein
VMNEPNMKSSRSRAQARLIVMNLSLSVITLFG